MNELQTMPLRFRVWDKESKRFCIPYMAENGHELIYVNDGDYGYPIELVGGMVAKLKDNAVVSQDTGLADKNGKPIFTGDIVRCRSFDSLKYDITGEVIYSCEACWVVTKDETHKEMLGIFFEKEVEVIGNIWEKEK